MLLTRCSHQPAQRKSRGHVRSGSRGYTVVELMMAVAIFSIGVTGVAAMQSVTTASNRFAKNMSVATQLARSWQEKLAMDATSWGGVSALALTQTRWLKRATIANNTWFLPENDDASSPTFGAAADARGQFVALNDPNFVFCTNIRLTRLLNKPGSGLIRTEVRVFWPKEARGWAGGNYCDSPNTILDGEGAAIEDFHFVYMTSAARETPIF